MTSVRFACPACSKALECDLELVGSKVMCPECGTSVTVPVDKDAAPATEQADPADGPAKADPKHSATEETDSPAAEKTQAASTPSEVNSDDDDDEPEVEDELQDYLEDGQPPKAIHKAFDRLDEFLKDDEDVEYIAVQHNPINPLNNLDPAFIAVSTRRLMICRPKLFGRMEFRSFHWYDVTNLRLLDNIGGTSITFKTGGGESISVDLIPKNQARHLYVIAQQCEEVAREERRKRIALEQSRARAQAMAHPPGPPAPAPDHRGDPVARLKQLKEMLDLGLITEEDYAAKKREFLSDL